MTFCNRLNSKHKNEKDNTLFTIEFTISSESLINSMIKTKQIIGSSINDDYTSLTFRASSIKSLKKYISKRENITYDNTLKLIWDLTKQLHYLITIEHECFYGKKVVLMDCDGYGQFQYPSVFHEKFIGIVLNDEHGTETFIKNYITR